jgi:hypothetical protein
VRTSAWITSAVLMITPALVAVVPPSTAWAQATAATPSPAAVKEATAHFQKGTDLFNAKKLDEALTEFRASYAAVASPNSHLYIARSLAQLGKAREAYAEFDKVAIEAQARAAEEPKYAPTAETAKLERDELAAKIALVTVTVSGAAPGATLRVGDQTIPEDAWGKPVPVDPGPVTIAVEAPPNAPVSQTVTVAAGDKRDVTLDATPKVAEVPPPAAPASSPNKTLRTAAFVAGGVGVIGLGVFAVAGISANATYSDLKDSCGGPCPASKQGDVDSGKTKQTIANVGLVVGGVGLGTGVALFLLSRSGSKKAEAVGSHLVVGPTYGGVRGAF